MTDGEQLPAVKGRVLLVGWDAADWKVISPMLDRGEMPHLDRLINRGTMGDLLTLRPILSPMLWNSIATGHRPERHGVHGFTEVDPATNTVRSVSSTTRQCKALWNMVTQAGGRAHVVNWYASHPAEPIRGVCVSDVLAHRLDNAPVPTGAVHPAEFAETFANDRMTPEEMEYETLRLFVPLIAEVDQDKDKTLVQLARLLAESFTVHNMATRVLADRPWNLAAVYYPGLDHFSHGFMNFHPPQLPGVQDEKYRLYSEVVNGAYRLHDLMLGRLLSLVDRDTHIVLLSDHGFHSDHLRPKRIPAEPVGPAVQHRPHGILVVAGPGIKEDERIYGADLLDITPTVLSLLGLPIGADMPGSVLADAFVEPPEIARVSSWEDIPGEDGRHPPGFVAPSQNQSLVLEQFAALGYLDLEEIQGSRGPDACRRENRWNLAQSLLQVGDCERAAEILIELCEQWPERGDFTILLAETLPRLGLVGEARRLIESLVMLNPKSAPARYLLGVACLEDKRFDEAVQHLQGVGAEYADRSDLHIRLGRAFMRLRRRDEAEDAFGRATQVDPHDSEGWLGLARCAARRRDWSLAESHALTVVGLDFHKPVAHAILGVARMRLGQREEADLALRVACQQAPAWVYPRRLRAVMWRGEPGDRAASTLQELTGLVKRIRSQRQQRKSFANVDHLAALDRLNDKYREIVRATAARSQQGKAAEQASAETCPALDLVVVSGLPRSGTSLMMQMLQAAGMPILTDGKRSADDDNPEGYLEWEAIKNLPTHPELLRQADGKVVKIVSPLLPYLPQLHHFSIVFVDRPIDEVLRSQATMRSRRGTAESPDLDRLRAAMTNHRNSTLKLLRHSPNVKLLIVPYPELIADPSGWVQKISQFLGDRVPIPDQMATAIRPSLYRNRITKCT